MNVVPLFLQYPIDYSVRDYCHSRMLGRRPLVSFDETLGKLILPVPPPADPSRPHDGVVELPTEQVQLDGEESIWGRSLVLEGPSKTRVCATILPDGESASFRAAEAR